MEWTASVPVAATTNVSAPKPPNNPVGLLHPKDSKEKEDVLMRELTEEKKEKKQPVVNDTKKKQKNTENRVHWGENVVHNMGNNKNDNKQNKGVMESQQEMVWRPKVTTGVATAATTNALAVKTTGTTEAPTPIRQEGTTSKAKATERTTATTATPPKPTKTTKTDATKKTTEETKETTTTTATAMGPKKTAATGTSEKKGQQTKQQPQVAQKGTKQQTQNTTGSQPCDRENLANATPNSERRNVNRRLTKVRTDWEEFKLLSFNVRGLNSESKQKVVDELVRRNRP
jgi:hypothetical protein